MDTIPDTADELIELFGKVIVPPETVKPELKVGLAFTVKLFPEFVPKVALPKTSKDAPEGKFTVELKVVFCEKVFKLPVSATPDTADALIELAGKVIVPELTVRPALKFGVEVCKAV